MECERESVKCNTFTCDDYATILLMIAYDCITVTI